MSVSMIERVAKAILSQATKNKSYAIAEAQFDLTNVMLDGHFDLKEIARAAIAALRVDISDMIEWRMVEAWNAMIDAALTDDPSQ